MTAAKKTSLKFRITVIILMIICAGVLVIPYFSTMSERIVMIETQANNSRVTFYALVANNKLKQVKGLQDVKTMPEDTAMLFTYGEPENHAMWMKDTPIPLDMLFIRDNVVVHIARDAQPFSEERIVSPEPFNAVLEINAGLADAYTISVGDIIF